MYAVDDETFLRARAILSALAAELLAQQTSGAQRPVDAHALIHRSTGETIPEGAEQAYLAAIADRLERIFPIEELFPRKRRSGRGTTSRGQGS